MMMCQKERGIEDAKSWLLILIFAISSVCGLISLHFLNKDLLERNDQVSVRSKSLWVA